MIPDKSRNDNHRFIIVNCPHDIVTFSILVTNVSQVVQHMTYNVLPPFFSFISLVGLFVITTIKFHAYKQCTVHVNSIINTIKGLLPRCLTLRVGETLQIKEVMGSWQFHGASCDILVHVLVELSVAVNPPTGLRELYTKVDFYARVNNGRFSNLGHPDRPTVWDAVTGTCRDGNQWLSCWGNLSNGMHFDRMLMMLMQQCLWVCGFLPLDLVLKYWSYLLDRYIMYIPLQNCCH